MKDVEVGKILHIMSRIKEIGRKKHSDHGYTLLRGGSLDHSTCGQGYPFANIGL
jgi:hypothetical protein